MVVSREFQIVYSSLLRLDYTNFSYYWKVSRQFHAVARTNRNIGSSDDSAF
jgi:hypothetical protein